MDYPILSLLIFMPLLGAVLTMFVKSSDPLTEAQNARWVSLFIALAVLLLSISLLAGYNTNITAIQFEENTSWLTTLNANYHLGVDGISILFVFLTALLTPICILVSWQSITQRVKWFMAAFLALESFVIGVFCALDFFLFYIFWEAMLIPMFLIIGIWGGENRVYAALKFFLYTFIGSVLMLLAMIYLYFANGNSFEILTMANLDLPLNVQILLWLALFAAFAVKVPMWPVHTWLPAAHVQAPTAGSVILAGVLLKMGGYGFLRFNLPILPEASVYFTPMVMVLSVIAIVYAALVAFAQSDIKKLIAYSSISHMGFVTLGIFANTQESVQGAVLQMLNHGIVSAALFMLVGVIYDRMHTRELGKFGGIVTKMPVYAAIMMLFTMASVGLPGTNSFVGEFLILSGSYTTAQVYVFIATFGVVLGAVYMLWLYRKMVFGAVTNPAVNKLTPMNMREIIMFIPLILLVFWIGLKPQYWLDISQRSVAQLLTQTHQQKIVLLKDRVYKPTTKSQQENH